MKYENFDIAHEKVQQIQGCEKMLQDLENDLEVHITLKSGFRIYHISLLENSVHEYKGNAKLLVETIKADLNARITSLKSDLEKL